MFLLLLSTASAGDFWAGGGVAGRGFFTPTSGYLGSAEAEAAALYNSDVIGARVDIDFTAFYAPEFAVSEAPPDVAVINIVRPEWAMIEAHGESWAARGGIVNAAFGLEDWDDWVLYLPTHGQYFASSPGRMAGGEAAYMMESGLTLTVGGGYDMDFESPIVEANVNYEADSWGTWSGVAVYPELDTYEAVIGAEAYPHEALTLALGGMGGLAGESPFVLGSLYAVVLPEGIVSPTARFEGAFDPDEYTGAADWNVGLGGAVKPVDWAKLLVEVKISGVSDAVEPGAYFSLSLFVPQPEEE